MSAPAPFDLPPDVLEAAAALLEQPEHARDDALAALQAAHPAHAEALREFAHWLTDSGRLLEQALVVPSVPELPHFDGYRVLRPLGEGAFGIVYLCEQPEPMQRQVAIKLLRPGAGDRGTLARFDSERRFLARLGHPAIAQIFDLGLLPDGRPWFVMEHVPGAPITEYCDRCNLSVEGRLRLFVRLCQGVQHAHDHGVLHRDLKPGNVLVVDSDDEAQPKIIDFGVARALERQPEGGDHRTETGRVVGTPGYMSPEQMAGDLGALDARSDVFSLGVMLYELLTSELPWGKRPTRTDSEPPRPSSRITTGMQRGATVAQQRGSQPKKLAARLRGDLDWIVLKALARERERRYATVSELAADVQRHLRSETVQAGPPSLGYRLRKWMRRNRAAVAMGTAVTVLICVGLWLLGGYRAAANDFAGDAEAAVASLLARANDAKLVGNSNYLALRQSLSREALALYDRFLSKRADDVASRAGRARALITLSNLHAQLTELERCESVARDAVVECEGLVAAAPDDSSYASLLATADRCVGRALLRRSRPAEASTWCQRAVDLLERLRANGSATDDKLVNALVDLYTALDDEHEAERRAALLRRAADLQGALLAEHPEQVQQRDTFADIALMRCYAAAASGDLTTARSLLAPIEPWLDGGEGLARATVIKVHDTFAKLAATTGDVATAITRCEHALAASRAWMRDEPDSVQALARTVELLESLSDLHANDEAIEDRLRPLRERVALSERWLLRFPEDELAAEPFVDSSRRWCEEMLATGRRDDLAGLDVAMRRACAQLQRLSPWTNAAARRADVLCTRGTLGLVADALGLVDADAIWEDVAAALEGLEAAQQNDPWITQRRVMYGIRVVARRLAAERFADAEPLLVRTRVLLDSCAAEGARRNASLIARLEVLVTVHHGDLPGAAERVDAMLDGAPDWCDLTLAADAMYSIWRAACPGGAPGAAGWRDRTIEIAQRAVDACRAKEGQGNDDPWLALPRLQCGVRIALARHDRGDDMPSDAIAVLMSSLASWRDKVHVNQWNEELYRYGLALVGR